MSQDSHNPEESQRISELLSTFEEFLRKLMEIENSVSDQSNKRELMAKLENRIVGKLLERKYAKGYIAEVLGRAITSVTEIRDVLAGLVPPPDKDNFAKKP